MDAFVLSQAKLFFWNAVMFMLLLFTNAKVRSKVVPWYGQKSVL